MTTDPDRADRLAALAARRAATSSGKRRRPAEASRILVAGAGTAAVLSMIAGMARSDLASAPELALVDQPAAIVEPVVAPVSPAVPTVPESANAPIVTGTDTPPTTTPTVSVTPIKTVTVAPPPPAPAKAPTARTNGSR